MYYETQFDRDGKYCTVGHGDGIHEFKDPVSVLPGPLDAAFRSAGRLKPRLAIDTWKLHPVGPGERLPFTWARVKKRGTPIAWDAKFSTFIGGDLYVDVKAEWPNATGCGHPDAGWTFHVRAP